MQSVQEDDSVPFADPDEAAKYAAEPMPRDNPEAREAWQRNNGPIYEPITREALDG